jgi:hypothetical protein
LVYLDGFLEQQAWIVRVASSAASGPIAAQASWIVGPAPNLTLRRRA